jgi:hypothetical protein
MLMMRMRIRMVITSASPPHILPVISIVFHSLLFIGMTMIIIRETDIAIACFRCHP